MAAEIATRYPVSPGASVIGAPGIRSQPAFAALANGMLANAADNDDTHKRALMHVGSVVVPTVLALAQTRHLSGRDLILALVAGYETGVRIGMAVMPTHYRFWHSTATNGTFAAAATAAKASRLDPNGVQCTLGLAGTQAAGLNTFFESGDMTKSIHPGKAALNGILSAELAELGATSPPDILEHPKGYLAAYALDGNREAVLTGLGERWEILENGFKYFPSILASHSALQATLELVARHRIDAHRIVRITNETYQTVASHFSNKDVRTPMAARVSVPYCVAVAAVDGTVTHAQFTSERIDDPLVRRLLGATDVVADAALTELYPDKFPARVTIALDDGAAVEHTVLFPKGDPQDPLSSEELEQKFVGNASGPLGHAEAEALVDAIRALPDAEDAGAVMSLLDAAVGGAPADVR